MSRVFAVAIFLSLATQAFSQETDNTEKRSSVSDFMNRIETYNTEKKVRILGALNKIENHLLSTNRNSKPEFSAFRTGSARTSIKNYQSHIQIKSRLKWAKAFLEKVESEGHGKSSLAQAVKNDIANYQRLLGNYVRSSQTLSEIENQHPSKTSITAAETKMIGALAAYNMMLLAKAKQSTEEAIAITTQLRNSELTQLLSDFVIDIENPSWREDRTKKQEISLDDGNEVGTYGYTKDEWRDVFQQVSGQYAYSALIQGGKTNIYYLRNVNDIFTQSLKKGNAKEIVGHCEEAAKNYPQFIKNNIGWYNTSSKLRVKRLLDETTENVLISLANYARTNSEIVEHVLNYRLNTKGVIASETRSVNLLLYDQLEEEELSNWRSHKASYAYTSFTDSVGVQEALEKLNRFETDLFIKYYKEPDIEADTTTSSPRQKVFEQYKAQIREQYGPVAAHLYSDEMINQMIDRAYPQLAGEIAAEETAYDFASWQDLQKAMEEKSVFVDIVTYPAVETGTAYGAIVLTKTGSPEFKFLGSGAYFDKLTKGFLRSLQYNLPFSAAYTKLFAPLGIDERKYDVMYFSPEKGFSAISLYAMKNPSTKRYLVQDLTIKRLYAPASLLNIDEPGSWQESATLIGYPTYGEGTSVLGKTFAALPGTKTEVDKIDSLFLRHGWDVGKLLESEVSEENLLRIKEPDILHIATHGYFLDEKSKLQNMDPLLNGGLALASANEFTEEQDQLLTSIEVTGLDLSNTKLVILSACESGLGKELEGEGVQGLQTAFIMAGTQSVLGTLWEINDAATVDFMLEFYKNLLESRDSEQLLRKSILDYFERYPENRAKTAYWAPFVQIQG